MSGRPAALVTGAAGGIGRPLVEALLAEGYRVAAVDRVRPELDTLFIEADLASAAGPAEAVERVVAEFGRLDLLVNSAGLFASTATAAVSAADWDLMMAVNLRAPFLAAQAAARHMLPRRSGCIVNLSSVASFYPRADQAAYCASKAGLEHLTRVLALDFAASGVRVNAIRPGVVETGMARESYGAEGLARWAAAVPLGRLAQTSDLAEAVLFLARAQHITGHVLTVDGGQTINFVKA